jgi:ketosteroid isomerase-like protein
VSIAADLFADVDRKDATLFAPYLAEDCVFQFANAPEVVGRDEIERGLAAFYDTIAALRHDLLRVWEVDAATIVRMRVTYTRLDGSEVSMPAAVIFERGDDGLIVDYRIFVDQAPLYT